MAKLVDALDLGPSNFCFESSSLSIRTCKISFITCSNKIFMVLPFTLQQLRIFKAIAAEKNLAQAAKILFISQPSLSKQIKTLENHLGILLFYRTGNKIVLTEAGIIFLQYSERILALCEESCRALNDLKDGERGNLKVGASQIIGAYLIPRLSNARF